MTHKGSYRILSAILAGTALLSCLTGCEKKESQDQTPTHVHTYAEQYSYDAENHWRLAGCEHKEEKADLGAHQFGADRKCTVCGYQAVTLLVKTNTENQKYTRTKPIDEMLKLGFAYGDNAADVQWVQAQKTNIEGYTISNGQITVKVSAMANYMQYTNEITVALEEAPIGVEAFFAQPEGGSHMLQGIVAGFSTTANNNEVVLADKETGRLISVTKMGTGKLLYGGYVLPGVEIGDEIIVPVSLVKEKQSADSANSTKIYAEYTGGTEYQTAVASKGNAVKYATDAVLIDSQADLQSFLSAANRENNHYKTVKLKGKMNFVMDATYENQNFWFSDKTVKNATEVQIDKITPCFNDPCLAYTTGMNFSSLVLGKPHQAAVDYKNPITADVEITAVFLGGNTKFAQFLILDQSWVTK